MSIVPELSLPPVIPPGFSPIVHAKVLGISAVNVILGSVPLQILFSVTLVINGAGFTVTAMVALSLQPSTVRV